MGRFDSFFVRRIGIGFRQDCQPPAHPDVFRAVAGLVSERDPFGVVWGEIAVVESRSAFLFQSLGNFWHHLFTQPHSNRFGRRRIVRDVVGQRILVFRTVGRVAIDEQMRIGFLDQSNECSCFWSFEFYEVAVQVQSLRIRAAAHNFRADLPRSVLWPHLIVGVGAIVRHEQQNVFLQPL